MLYQCHQESTLLVAATALSNHHVSSFTSSHQKTLPCHLNSSPVQLLMKTELLHYYFKKCLLLEIKYQKLKERGKKSHSPFPPPSSFKIRTMEETCVLKHSCLQFSATWRGKDQAPQTSLSSPDLR